LGIFSPHVLRTLLPVIQQTTKVQLSIASGVFKGIEFGDNMTALVPLAIFGVLALLGALLFFSARKFTKYKKIRRSETWTCGIYPTSRMEYTATSFSQPLRIVFRTILRPEKELTKEGNADYFLESMHYNTSMKPIYEDYLYHPINKLIIFLSGKFRLLQSGQIQLYVIYIFLALIFLLWWAL
jgi:hydrogenase-4 component B